MNYVSPLNKALLSDDDLIAVVRSHIYVERLVNRLIDSLLPYPDSFSGARINFSHKIDLALALGLKQQFGPPLKKIGSIRNQFAHEAEAKITKKNVTDLFNTLDREEKELLHESLRLTEEKTKSSVKRAYSDLEARDQFTLMIVTLHSMLIVAISEITGES